MYIPTSETWLNIFSENPSLKQNNQCFLLISLFDFIIYQFNFVFPFTVLYRPYCGIHSDEDPNIVCKADQSMLHPVCEISNGSHG